MMTIPAVPPVPDADRYWSGTIGAATASANVPFPVYGDGTDLDVNFNGTPVPAGNWSFVSAGNPGVPLSSLPVPITDGQILFFPPLPNGFLEIIGDCHPRQLSWPTPPGIGRREFSQTIGSLLSTMRELYRAIKQGRAAGLTYNAVGPIAQRGNFDTAAPPFAFLQTDDAQGRVVLYAKQSTNTGDWSGPLVVSGPAGSNGSNGNNGNNGANGAYAAGDPLATSVLSTDTVPILSGGVSKRVLRDTLLAPIPPGSRVASLWTGDGQGLTTTGGSAALAIMADGTARAWGAGNDSGNGDSGASARWVPKTILLNPANAVAPTLPWTQAARSGSSMYLLDSAGLVFAAGGNAAGQLGVGDTATRRRFTLVTTLQAAGILIASIVTQPATWGASNGSTVYFLTTTGQVYAAGANGSGQIGDGTSTNRSVPTRCGTLANIAKVAPGGDYNGSRNFVAVLDASGNLYAWGDDTYGQLGDGATTARSSPYLTLPGVGDMALSMSAVGGSTGGHIVAVMTNGTVRTVGCNAVGQLGLGDTTTRGAWTQVAGIANAVKAYAGGGYYGISGVLCSDGTIRLWGENNTGQLGNGTTANSLTPVTPAGAFSGKAVSIHMHGYYSNLNAVALLCSDGTVWAAGYNGTGALGQGNGLVNLTTFTQIMLPPGVTAAATAIKFAGGVQGDASLFVQLSDGTLWATGANGDGRLGTQVGNLRTVDGLERVIFA